MAVPRYRSSLGAGCALALVIATRVAAAQAPVPQAAPDSIADSVTLTEALARARSSRPIVRGAAAGMQRARGAARLATLIPNPQATAQADERTPTRQATLSQPLGWIVRRGADAELGRALVARAAADSAQLLADLGRDVRRAFYGALAAAELARLANEQRRLADSLVTLADRRVAAGDISALERDQIALETSRVRLVFAQARERSRVAEVELGRAVVWEGVVPLRTSGSLAEGLDEVDAVAALTGAEPAPAPAIRAALADSTAGVARLRALRLARIPVPALIAGIEWGVSGGGGAATTNQDAAGTPILGLSLPLPLWNHGGEAVAEARGAAAESAARLDETRLAAAGQIAAAQVRVVESSMRARYARDSLVTEARRLRAGAIRLYDAGRAGILPVIDALRVERDVAQTVVQELLAFQNARADLSALLGLWP